MRIPKGNRRRAWFVEAEWDWKLWALGVGVGRLWGLDGEYGVLLVVGPLMLSAGRRDAWEMAS